MTNIEFFQAQVLFSAKILKMIYMSRVSIFKKRAENLYLGGFWGEKLRGANGFSIWPFLTLTGPLVKIGGQKLILELYQYWYENMFYRFWTCQLRCLDKRYFRNFFFAIFAPYFLTRLVPQWISHMNFKILKESLSITVH